MHSSAAAFEVDARKVADLRAVGLSWNEIADELGIGRGTAERAYRSLSQKPQSENLSAVLTA
jgi:hypothetical protein